MGSKRSRGAELILEGRYLWIIAQMKSEKEVRELYE